MAKQLAESRGDSVEYKMLGEDYQAKELFETFPGARTFPQINATLSAYLGKYCIFTSNMHIKLNN